MSYEQDENDPPPWFTNLPPETQALWVQLGLAPTSWGAAVGVSSTPELTWKRWVPLAGATYAPYEAPEYDPFAQWGQQIGQYGYLMRSLAPLYASSMVRMIEAIPQYAEAAARYRQNVNYFAGRAAYHAVLGDPSAVAADVYRVYREAAHGAYYDWRATAGAPLSMLSSASKFASFMFAPDVAAGRVGMTWRAFGWPFFGAFGQIGAAGAMAPYVSQMYQMFPEYTQSLITGVPTQAPSGLPATYTAGFLQTFAYPTQAEAFGGGVAQWTVAQVGMWSAVAGVRALIGGQGLGGAGRAALQTIVGTGGVSFMQAGLGLTVPITTQMIARGAAGLPMFFTPEEQQQATLQFGAGVGLQIGGAAWQAWIAPRFAAPGFAGFLPYTNRGFVGTVGFAQNYAPIASQGYRETIGYTERYAKAASSLNLLGGTALGVNYLSGNLLGSNLLVEQQALGPYAVTRWISGGINPLELNPLGTTPLGTNDLWGNALPTNSIEVQLALRMWPITRFISGGINPLELNPLGTTPLESNYLPGNPLGTNSLEDLVRASLRWQPSMLARGLTVAAGVAGAYGLSELLGGLGARISPTGELVGRVGGAIGGYIGASELVAWAARTAGLGKYVSMAPSAAGAGGWAALGLSFGPQLLLTAGIQALWMQVEAEALTRTAFDIPITEPLTYITSKRFGGEFQINPRLTDQPYREKLTALRGLIARYGEIYQNFMTQPWSAYYDYIPPSGRLGPSVYAGSRWQPMPVQGLEQVPRQWDISPQGFMTQRGYAWSAYYQYPGMAAPVYAGKRGPAAEPWWPMQTIFMQPPYAPVAVRVPAWNYEYQYPGMAAPVAFGSRYPQPGMWPTEVAWYGNTGYTRNVTSTQYQYPGMAEAALVGSRYVNPWTGIAPSVPGQAPFGPYTYWQDSNLVRAGVGGWTIDISTGQLVPPEGGIIPGSFDAAVRTLEYAGFTTKEIREALAGQYPELSAAQIEALARGKGRGGGGTRRLSRSAFGGYSSWTRPWTGIPLQIEYQRWGDAYGYEEAEGVSEGQVRQWIYAAISDFASTGIIMPGPMSWDDQLADAVMRRISPSLSTSLYDEGNR